MERLKLSALRRLRNVDYLSAPFIIPATHARSVGNDRSPRAPVTMSRPAANESQYDLFPQRVTVEALDAKAVAGSRTRVTALYRVRYEREPGVHQVFLDYHGWYCAEHGRGCKAVRAVASKPPLSSKS